MGMGSGTALALVLTIRRAKSKIPDAYIQSIGSVDIDEKVKSYLSHGRK